MRVIFFFSLFRACHRDFALYLYFLSLRRCSLGTVIKNVLRIVYRRTHLKNGEWSNNIKKNHLFSHRYLLTIPLIILTYVTHLLNYWERMPCVFSSSDYYHTKILLIHE